MRLLGAMIALGLLAAAGAVWAGSDERPPPSPRRFVVPVSCDGRTPCPQAYWVFGPSDCEGRGLSHPPGTVVRFEDGTTLQCRCRLTWVRAKPGGPPEAGVGCGWVDVDAARAED